MSETSLPTPFAEPGLSEPLPLDGAEILDSRTLGLLGATGVGVGAIVGGGILALAGVAFATTGPSAVVAFTLNGLIALLTALTFAEMASSFPESGGTYTFAKKVLSVEAAFMVGWVVWFASIVAAVLYALGFAAFAQIFVVEMWAGVGGTAPDWVSTGGFAMALAVGSTAFYTFGLVRKQGGGGQWETVGKVVVFGALILAGLWVLPSRDPAVVTAQLKPFFAAGGLGLLQAMGYTFIALQGFDLIAAVGGEVKDPARNLPRAMIGSLVIALMIYVPLLLLVATVGVTPGGSITELAAEDPEAVVAIAAEQFLGRTGFWMVIVAALLSMVSALQANLLAASHIALAMAKDRNLPGRLRRLHPSRGTPVAAVLVTSATVVGILLVVSDVAAAGAMSSLIFLLSFTLAHWMGILVRHRGGGKEGAFLLPFFPVIPVVGGLACFGLAVFQGLAVPSAGLIAAGWLTLGGTLYALVFSRRARVADAAAQALDPQLVRLRGRNPLVLVPIANPASARSMVTLASSLAAPVVGKVLLLYVVKTPERWSEAELPPQLVYAQEVLGRALCASFSADFSPQALTTVAGEPWREICRVARTYQCESLLLGLGDLGKSDGPEEEKLEWLLSEVSSDVVLLGAAEDWRLENVKRVLVPVGGRRDQSHLRARMLGSLCRGYDLEVVYLGIVDPESGDAQSLETDLRELAEDEAPGSSRLEIVHRKDVAEAVVEAAKTADLVILGLRREGRRSKTFGEIPVRVAREAGTAVLMIGQR